LEFFLLGIGGILLLGIFLAWNFLLAIFLAWNWGNTLTGNCSLLGIGGILLRE